MNKQIKTTTENKIIEAAKFQNDYRKKCKRMNTMTNIEIEKNISLFFEAIETGLEHTEVLTNEEFSYYDNMNYDSLIELKELVLKNL